MLRDRRALAYAFLIPALLYPLMMAVLLFGYQRLSTWADERTLSLQFEAPAGELDQLRSFLIAQPRVVLAADDTAPDTSLIVLEALRWHEELGVGISGADLPADLAWQFRIHADISAPAGLGAALRLTRLLDEHRSQLWYSRARSSGVSDQDWQVFELSSTNLAQGRAMGRFVLSSVLPVMFVVMIALGSFYPAIDSIAGERERGSWETTLTFATPRSTVLAAKLLVSATLGFLSGLINAVSMSIALRVFFAELLGELNQLEIIELSFPMSAVPMYVLAGVVLSITLSACMMVLAAFARSFREGQAMVAPFYLVILVPTLFLADPDLRLSLNNALVPVVGLGLALRSSLLVEPPSFLVVVAVAVNLALALVILRCAELVLRNDEVLEGSSHGGLLRFLRQRRHRRAASVNRASGSGGGR